MFPRWFEQAKSSRSWARKARLVQWLEQSQTGKLGRLTAAVEAMMLRHKTPHDGMDVPGVGKISVFPDSHKIVMGSPLDFNRENIDQYLILRN